MLHDVDRDVIDKDPAQHTGEKLEEITGELSHPSPVGEGIEGEVIQTLLNDIRSHYQDKRHEDIYALDSDLRKHLISIDELSGLMYAYARMRGGSFDGMEVSGVMKKIKDTKFAAGVDRSHVKHCESQL